MRTARLETMTARVKGIEDQLADTYFCNFSIFQSMPDSWAIKQLFPVVPIHRLNEKPTRHSVLCDVTCDSDGKVSHYVSSNEDRKFLELHALTAGERYYLGFFLMGAYQDIMGDSHNLFGRVAEVHVYGDRDEDDNFWIEKVIPGTEVREILAQVQYFPNDLQRRMDSLIKEKIESGQIRPKRGMQILEQYMNCFRDSTYYDTRSSNT